MNEYKEPTYLLEQSEINKQGFGIMKFSDDVLKENDIITYDFKNGDFLWIAKENFFPLEKGFAYLVKTVDINRFNPRFLQAGTRYHKVSNISGSYEEEVK